MYFITVKKKKVRKDYQLPRLYVGVPNTACESRNYFLRVENTVVSSKSWTCSLVDSSKPLKREQS